MDFLGFLMGIHQLLDLYDYWATSDYLHVIPIASQISRKQFTDIKRFTNNETLVDNY